VRRRHPDGPRRSRAEKSRVLASTRCSVRQRSYSRALHRRQEARPVAARRNPGDRPREFIRGRTRKSMREKNWRRPSVFYSVPCRRGSRSRVANSRSRRPGQRKEFFLLNRQPFRAHRRYTLQARAADRGRQLKAPRLALLRQAPQGRQAEPRLQLLGRVTLCQQPRSRDHAGDSRSAVGGAFARHMPRRRQLGRYLPQ
jgi:hypothetical protein